MTTLALNRLGGHDGATLVERLAGNAAQGQIAEGFRGQADARVVHRTTYRNSWGRWEIGIFFTAIADSQRVLIGREITRLLTH